MRSLQRLQQNILAADLSFGRGITLTPRAERLRTAFRRGMVVGALSTATLVGAAAYVKVGPGSYDPQKLYLGDASDSRVMASIFDHHRQLLAARERVREIKDSMISGEGTESLEEKAAQLRSARTAEQQIARDFARQTYGLSQEQIRRITGNDDTQPAELVATATPSSPRFRP